MISLVLAASLSAQACDARATWQAYRDRFIAPDVPGYDVAPGVTVAIVSNTRNGRSAPSCRTANRPSG